MENFRTAVIIFLFCSLLISCSSNLEETSFLNLDSDFESLMGKGHERWQYIQTEEDRQNLQYFKTIYLQNIPLLKEQLASTQINVPKVLHFIWLGPKPFPRSSVENVRSWIAHHPNWKVKFWTDRERPLPHPIMEYSSLENFSFQSLKDLYTHSDNYGEKSDLLRLEILYKEGGVYVDHDVKCLQNFEALGKAFDFYCGMELPYKTCLSTSVLPTNNLLGSIPNHPILLDSMHWLQANWNTIEQQYPGKDRDSLINRVAHRTFYSLGLSFKQRANQTTKDIALPAYFFNAPDEKSALFARHQYAGQWFENESEFEKMARKRLMLLSKKTNQLLLFLSLLGGLNVFGFVLLFARQGARQK